MICSKQNELHSLICRKIKKEIAKRGQRKDKEKEQICREREREKITQVPVRKKMNDKRKIVDEKKLINMHREFSRRTE